MGFWDSISRFAGNLTGGLIGDSDEERRRRQQQQAQQKAATSRSVASFAGAPAPKTAAPTAPGAPKSTFRGPAVPFPSTRSNPEFDRRTRMEQAMQEGQSFEKIAADTGLSLTEIADYADQKHPGYGKKPVTLQSAADTAGKVIGDSIKSIGDIVTMPVKTAQFAADKKNNAAKLQDIQGQYNRGEISPARAMEDANKLTEGVIGRKPVLDPKTGKFSFTSMNPLEFAGQFTDAGVNAAGVLPAANSAKVVSRGGKIISTALNEGATWGTIDTANDIVHGRATPERTLANYGLNTAGAAGGGVAGKVYKDVRTAQASPANEAGFIAPLMPDGSVPKTKEEVKAALDAMRAGGKQSGYIDKTPPKFDNRPETLLARATDAGMQPETAVSLMKQHGANKFRIMLDESNNLTGAKNPDALATHAINQIPDGNKVIGGTATKTTPVDEVNTPQDTPPIEAYDTPAPKAAPSVAEQITTDANKAYKSEQRIWGNIDKELKKAGYDPVDVHAKIDATNEGRYKPTETELSLFGLVQREFDSARGDLAAKGVTIEGNQAHYFPNQRVGTVKTSADQYTREDFMNFGYANKRTGAIPVEERDYSTATAVDYTFKARHRDLALKQAIATAAEKDGRTVTKESVEQAAKDTIELQDTIKDHAAKSGKVIQHDTLGRLNQIGANEGYTLTTNTTRAGVMAQEPKNILERAGVYDSGFQQYVNADGYAAELMRMTDEAGSDVSATLPQAIGKAFPEGDASSMENIVGWAQWRLEKATTPEQKQAIVSATFRTAAKSELQRLGKTTIFADRKTAKVVNEQMNHILLNDAYQRNAAEMLDRFISHRINESLRGGNVLSALFEAGDFFNILSDFGGKNLAKSKIGFGKIDGDYYGMSKRYGKGDVHFLSPDMSKDVGKLDEIWSDPRTTVGQKLYRSAQNVRDKSLLFTYVEKWKTELFLRQADAFYRARGLQGKQLVDMVNNHYDKTMLPSTALTVNRLMGKLPHSLTQYLAWGINSTKRLGRTIGGNNEFGKYADMSRTGRIARGVVTEIVPKALTASILGIPMTQVLGGRDFTGMSSGDYSGINQEDKNAIDAAVNLAGISPVMGMLVNYYNGYRVNEIAGLNGEAQSNWAASATGKNASMLIPYFSQAKKVADVVQGQQQGYFTSRDGRVTTEALPMGEAIQGAILGKNYTQTMRDYNDNPNIISVANGKASPVDLLTHNETVDNVNKALGGKTSRDYTRPLNKQYSEEFKKAEQGARRELLKGGRQFNDYLDTLRQNHPDFYQAYLGTMDGNQVKPEYYRTIAPTKDGQMDLTIFKTLGDRKRQLQKDFGTAYDPMYDLPEEQAKAYLRYKSTPTGDNIAVRNQLNKEQWYKDLKANQAAFYEANPKAAGGEDFKQTQRVKDWSALDTELSAYYYQKGDEKPAWADKYPLVYELKQYEFDSPESKAFFKANYDAWKAQSDAFDRDRLETINKMRKIEGYPAMSMDAYKQVANVVDTEGDSKSSSSKKSSKGYYDKDGNWHFYGGGGGSSRSSDRTGVADTIDNLSSKNTGIKAPKINYGTMKNPTKVIKTKRAKGTSSIRINI